MPANDRKLRAEELGRVAPGDYSPRLKQRLAVVLDDVRSRHNVGSIFRTADAFGAERIILCGFTPCPPHREIEKTALGATMSVPWEHAPDALEAIRKLKEEGYTVVAIELTEQASPLREFVPGPAPLAIVLGNEVSGVCDQIVRYADACVHVPQHGSKHSLNVSVCAGVVLHELLG